MANRPNVLIFMSDDQGFGDLSCFGCTDFQTPHLDPLAAGGVRLTQWYAAAPVCSPSRAALLTGRHPVRAGVPANVRPDQPGLMPDVPSLPRLLKQRGYRTYLSGKWHLGEPETCRPHRHGFDHWFGFLQGCIDYYSHIFYWALSDAKGGQARHDLWLDNVEQWREGEYFIDLMTDQAITWLREAAACSEPFYLHMPFNAPHYPMHAPRDAMDRHAHLPRDRQLMAAMLTTMDDAIGRILRELDTLGLTDNTFVIFQPDHGPSAEPRNWTDGRREPYTGASTGGLRGHKFSVYEGGIRVPTIARLPGVIPAGTTVDEPGAGSDWLPTILRALGEDVPADLPLDGRDVLAMLRGNADSPHEQLCWLHAGGDPAGPAAIRTGDWKLIEGYAGTELYHLRDDPGESQNRAASEPARTADLQARLTRWRAGLPG